MLCFGNRGPDPQLVLLNKSDSFNLKSAKYDSKVWMAIRYLKLFPTFALVKKYIMKESLLKFCQN